MRDDGMAGRMAGGMVLATALLAVVTVAGCGKKPVRVVLEDGVEDRLDRTFPPAPDTPPLPPTETSPRQ